MDADPKVTRPNPADDVASRAAHRACDLNIAPEHLCGASALFYHQYFMDLMDAGERNREVLTTVVTSGLSTARRACEFGEEDAVTAASGGNWNACSVADTFEGVLGILNSEE